MTEQHPPGPRYTPSELLWLRAHEHVRRGEFAQAVRLLAQCYSLLEQAKDPRVHEVHRRWTEVHKMYLEDGARAAGAAKQAVSSLQGQAEEAANRGDLVQAISLYERLIAASPQNELARERLQELQSAKHRADDLQRPATAPATAPVMAMQDAPVGMKSLDVSIEFFEENNTLAAPAQSQPVAVVEQRPSRDAVASDVPFLEELLVRIHQRRRAA
jgi:tetratricopeptide (TPR) repeat protein